MINMQEYFLNSKLEFSRFNLANFTSALHLHKTHCVVPDNTACSRNIVFQQQDAKC